MHVQWRPITRDDAAAWLRLLGHIEAEDQTGENYDEDDAAHDLADKQVDLAEDTIAGFNGQEMLAYTVLRGRRSDTGVDRIWLDGGVHPSHRGQGLGNHLLTWQTKRGAQLHAQHAPDRPGELHVALDERHAKNQKLYQAHGFRPARWFFEMACELGDAVEPGPLAGLQVVPFEPEYDERTRQAHCEAFLDHWAHTPADRAAWEH